MTPAERDSIDLMGPGIAADPGWPRARVVRSIEKKVRAGRYHAPTEQVVEALLSWLDPRGALDPPPRWAA